jgi:hypothetical protein
VYRYSLGLVFPRLDVGLAEQIVGGLVPLPVVREPYSAAGLVGYHHFSDTTLLLCVKTRFTIDDTRCGGPCNQSSDTRE